MMLFNNLSNNLSPIGDVRVVEILYFYANVVSMN